MTGATRILVAGIGNIFLGDDAFGVEVAQRMAGMALPRGVRVVDFGIRGIDLTYALLDGCEVAILVDAVAHGQKPGTVYLIQPEIAVDAEATPGIPMLDMHNMDPARVLAVVKSMGGSVRRVLLVGCEPSPMNCEDDMQMELSPPVKAAVDEAIKMIQSLIDNILSNETSSPAPLSPSRGTPGQGWGECLLMQSRARPSP